VPGFASAAPIDPVVVVTNPDEDCSSGAFGVLVSELLDGPEPEVETIRAAEALRELRTDATA
jgi:hypothetical protein